MKNTHLFRDRQTRRHTDRHRPPKFDSRHVFVRHANVSQPRPRHRPASHPERPEAFHKPLRVVRPLEQSRTLPVEHVQGQGRAEEQARQGGEDLERFLTKQGDRLGRWEEDARVGHKHSRHKDASPSGVCQLFTGPVEQGVGAPGITTGARLETDQM